MALVLCLQEHLFLVCELLRANLYEFQKYNRENGDEPYFTLPHLQRIAHQVWLVKALLTTANILHLKCWNEAASQHFSQSHGGMQCICLHRA